MYCDCMRHVIVSRIQDSTTGENCQFHVQEHKIFAIKQYSDKTSFFEYTIS